QLLKHLGYKFSGSDIHESHFNKNIEKMGVEIFIGQKKENINKPDLVVYTDAIADDNEELIKARELDVPVVTRGVFLGALMRNYKYSIGDSVSHGRYTTSSFNAILLMHFDVDL